MPSSSSGLSSISAETSDINAPLLSSSSSSLHNKRSELSTKGSGDGCGSRRSVFSRGGGDGLNVHNGRECSSSSSGGGVGGGTRLRRQAPWCSLFLTFFVGTCFGLALFPFLVTLMSFQLLSEINTKEMGGKGGGMMRGTPPPPPPPHSSGGFEGMEGGGNSTAGDDENSRMGGSQGGGIPLVRFEDVAGMEEAKSELKEVAQFLREPEQFTSMGARLPRGILLVGPPGSGKTMLARAVATEANVPYLYTSGSEFIEIYVGQGAKRVRDLFAYARTRAPCIVFVDEMDAVGGKRMAGIGGGGGQREHDQTLNQLLVEMDGFNASSGVVVLGATNRVDVLDPALLRPGRFDRVVYVPLPDAAGREKILRKYLSRVPIKDTPDDPLDVRSIAKITPGFSGAELENLVNEAAILAASSGKRIVGLEELQDARDKVSMGPARKSMIMSEAQRRLTAYHEAGHALVAYYLQPNSDPIHKATIVSRGAALGFVEQVPIEDRYNHGRLQLEARLAVAMGGRTAEELVFGKGAVSTGASSDISMATRLAYKMVSEWGMSEKLGPLDYNQGVYGQTPGWRGGGLSDQSAGLVEKEVKRLVNEAQRTAERILRKHRRELDRIAVELLEKESLTGDDIIQLLNPLERNSSKSRNVGASGGTINTEVKEIEEKIKVENVEDAKKEELEKKEKLKKKEEEKGKEEKEGEGEKGFSDRSGGKTTGKESGKEKEKEKGGNKKGGNIRSTEASESSVPSQTEDEKNRAKGEDKENKSDTEGGGKESDGEGEEQKKGKEGKEKENTEKEGKEKEKKEKEGKEKENTEKEGKEKEKKEENKSREGPWWRWWRRRPSSFLIIPDKFKEMTTI